MATDEDKTYKIDYWAKLFKAKTWEDLKILAQKDNAFKEACETVYNLNQNDEVRYLCETREKGQRILRTYESLIKMRDKKLAKKDFELTEKESALAEKDSIIAALQAQLKAYQK